MCNLAQFEPKLPHPFSSLPSPQLFSKLHTCVPGIQSPLSQRYSEGEQLPTGEIRYLTYTWKQNIGCFNVYKIPFHSDTILKLVL